MTLRISARPSAGLVPLLLLLPSCTTEPRPAPEAPPRAPEERPEDLAVPVVKQWGTMREVLRDGRTEGRVALVDVLGPHSLAVGASEGLAAEITVVEGTAHLAEVVDPASGRGLRSRAPTAGERATLLVVADVAEWSEHPLSGVPDLAALEASVRAIAGTHGFDPSVPFPFRVEGLAGALHLHVLDHSCPIADPDGPQPWRFTGSDQAVVLVGFHAEGSAGVLTHHGQQTHTHALLPERGISGHLDEVSFASGATLYLPAR